MKHIYYYLTSLLYLFTLLANTACEDDKNALVQDTFEISNSELNKEIDSRSTTITIPVKTSLRASQWEVNSNQKWITAFQQEDKIVLSILDSQDTQKRFAKITVKSELTSYVVNITQFGINDIEFRQDQKITITGGQDNQHHNGAGIEKSFDGDLKTTYHSPWESPFDTPTTEFPVVLEYYFDDNTQEIDRIMYHGNGGNGTFGKLELYYSTTSRPASEDDYTKIGDYDLGKSGKDHTIDLPAPVKAKAIKFKVLTGAGDNKHPDPAKKGGFATCTEMEFYQKANYRDLNGDLLNVFTDNTCTALIEGVTDEAIEALPSENFKRVAYALKNNTYDPWEKGFRIREYKAYSDVVYWAERLQTKKYSNLDNPTGVYVSKDEEMVVLVGDTHGQKISIQCIWEENVKKPGSSTDYFKQTQAAGDSYPLAEGVNLLKMKGPGQLFIMYNVTGEGLITTQPQPIKIHIPLGSGVVNGFFDLEEHKTDAKYVELINKATHKYFCVRGKRMILYFHRLKMQDAAPSEILSAINLWDDIVGWEQSLMGISSLLEEGKINNHMFSISPEGSYMWASDYRMGFVYTYLKNILLRENVMAVEDNAWGPAHEMGHVHQGAINWPTSTESSNNLFSNYVIRKLGKYKSRGRGLGALATSIYKDDRAWWNMGTSTHQNEDTEIHMRMNWQLWIYYDLCMGHEEKSEYWPRVFDLMRTKYNVPENDPGKRQMAFAKATSEAAGQDLTEFFETWGFFKPVDNESVSQYGDYIYNVTPQMIAETKEALAVYPKAVPIQYIEDRRVSDFTSGDYRYKEVGDVGYYTQFKNNETIITPPTYTLKKLSNSDSEIKIQGGDRQKAVAFEVKKIDKEGRVGKTTYFSNFFTFSVPRNISMIGSGVFAVQSDGTRIQLTKVQ